MNCSIMQPTYFPWAGYFKMINDVNLFIFLDDAQYSKGSWHSRNKILNKSKEIWLTISLKKHKLNYVEDLPRYKCQYSLCAQR
jgi:hypothetical protein